MSEVRTVTNLIGNGVATIVIARWENEFDAARAARQLNGDHATEEAELAEEGSVVT